MKRKAFTLIEIMVAIAIMAILGGLALYALRGAGNSSKIQATRVTLENLKSMLAEYELKTKLTSGPNQWQLGGVFPHTAGAGQDFWHVIGANPAYDYSVAPLSNLSLVSDVAANSGRFKSDSVYNTAIAMLWLAKIPSNAAALAKLPPEQTMKGVGGVSVPNGPLVDAWGNPIIFVPSDGLRVQVGGAWTTITAPNNRPFFASAGPDGDFSKGDDNIYSFEQ